MAQITSSATTRTPAIKPEEWDADLDTSVANGVRTKADDINDVEWLSIKKISGLLREIRTEIGESNKGNWIAFTKSGVLNITANKAQDLELAYDWLKDLPIEEKILKKMSTRSIAICAKACMDEEGKPKENKKLMTRLSKGPLSEPELRVFLGLTSPKKDDEIKLTPKQLREKFRLLQEQAKADADRLADEREWLQKQLQEMHSQLNMIRKAQGDAPLPLPEYPRPAYEGPLDAELGNPGVKYHVVMTNTKASKVTQ